MMDASRAHLACLGAFGCCHVRSWCPICRQLNFYHNQVAGWVYLRHSLKRHSETSRSLFPPVSLADTRAQVLLSQEFLIFTTASSKCNPSAKVEVLEPKSSVFGGRGKWSLRSPGWKSWRWLRCFCFCHSLALSCSLPLPTSLSHCPTIGRTQETLKGPLRNI